MQIGIVALHGTKKGQLLEDAGKLFDGAVGCGQAGARPFGPGMVAGNEGLANKPALPGQLYLAVRPNVLMQV